MLVYAHPHHHMGTAPPYTYTYPTYPPPHAYYLEAPPAAAYYMEAPPPPSYLAHATRPAAHVDFASQTLSVSCPHCGAVRACGCHLSSSHGAGCGGWPYRRMRRRGRTTPVTPIMRRRRTAARRWSGCWLSSSSGRPARYPPWMPAARWLTICCARCPHSGAHRRPCRHTRRIVLSGQEEGWRVCD
jgi:hypothetical protein